MTNSQKNVNLLKEQLRQLRLRGEKEEEEENLETAYISKFLNVRSFFQVSKRYTHVVDFSLQKGSIR